MKIEFTQLNGGYTICKLPALAVYYWYAGLNFDGHTNPALKGLLASPYNKAFVRDLSKCVQDLIKLEINFVEPPKFCLGLDGRLHVLEKLEWRMINDIWENNSDPLLTAFEECCLEFLYLLEKENLLKYLMVT